MESSSRASSPKVVAGALGIHDEFLAVLVAAVHLDLAALDDEQRVGRVIFMDHNGIFGKGTAGAAAFERSQFFRRKTLKYFYLVQHLSTRPVVIAPPSVPALIVTQSFAKTHPCKQIWSVRRRKLLNPPSPLRGLQTAFPHGAPASLYSPLAAIHQGFTPAREQRPPPNPAPASGASCCALAGGAARVVHRPGAAAGPGLTRRLRPPVRRRQTGSIRCWPGRSPPGQQA